MAKILILGGTGAIGHYLVKELAGTEHEVFVTSRKKRDDLKNIHYLYGNAKNDQFLHFLLRVSYDCIVDFMHWGTEEFKNVYPRLLTNTGHYIFLSSYRVYANADMKPLKEDSPLLLDTVSDNQFLKTDDYALAKARCERLLENSGNKNFTILRPSITFSTSRFQIGTLEANIILPRALNGKPILVAKDMLDKRAAIGWAGTAGKMIASLLMRDEAQREIFNIGSRESHTWRTIADYYHKLLGVDFIPIDYYEYVNLGFSRYQVKYDRMFNRILDSYKILNFMANYATPLEEPPLYSSLKYEINLNIKQKGEINENLKISHKMDKYILEHKEDINLLYGDKFKLKKIADTIQKNIQKKTDLKSIIKIIDEKIAKKEYEQALTQCVILCDLYPDQLDVYLKASEVYCKKNDLESAENIVKQGMKLILDVKLWIVYYDLAIYRKDYLKSLDITLEMIQKFPKTISGYFRAANACIKLGELDRAERYCLNGFKLNSKAIEIWLVYADIAMLKKDFDEAIIRWQKFSNLFPDRIEGYFNTGLAYRNIGNIEEAKKLFIKSIEIYPENIHPWIAYYELAMFRKDFLQALNIASKIIDNFPKQISGFFRAAKASLELGEISKAEKYCLDGLKINPEAIQIWLIYAEIPMHTGELKKALEFWTKFRKLFPSRHEGYTRAAVACLRLGDYELAQQYCNEFLSVYPVQIQPLIVFFEVAMRKRDLKLALQICQKMQSTFPNECSGYIRAASVYMEMEEWAEAEQAARQGVEITPNSSVPWLVYADVAVKKGNFDLAIQRFSEIRNRFPLVLEGYIRAAQAYKKIGNFKRAREICEEGMQIGQDAFEILTYTIAEIMAQAPDDYFSSIEYLNVLYEKKLKININEKFYKQLYHCSLLLMHKLQEEKDNKNIKLILKLFLSDTNGQHCSVWFLTFLSKCYLPYKERKKIINDIIQEYSLNMDFAILFNDNVPVLRKKEAICNILQLKNNICVFHVLSFTQDWENYKYIVNELINDNDLLKIFSSYGLYILLNLVEFLNQEQTDKLTNTLINIKDKKSAIYPFLQYRQFYSRLLRASAPALQLSKKLRIAVCISGQLRGYKETFESWKAALNLDNHNVSYFVHTWKNIGRKLPISHAFYSRSFTGSFLKAYQEIDPPLESIRKHYKNFYSLLVGSNYINTNELENFYNTKKVIVEDENEELFINFSNQKKMHYKIFACNEFLYQPIQNFDLVIRIRPDFLFEENFKIDLNKIYHDSLSNNVIYAEGKHVTNWIAELALGDMLAIGIPTLMNIYARTYLDHYKFAKINHFQHKTTIFQHVSITYQLLAHGIGMKSLSANFKLIDPKPLLIHDIYEAIKSDIANHPQPTYDDRILLRACEQDLVNA